jgi:hypothetical protein
LFRTQERLKCTARASRLHGTVQVEIGHQRAKGLPSVEEHPLRQGVGRLWMRLAAL